MNLNIENWKEFKIYRNNQPGLFDIFPCKCGCAGDLEDGNDINYIGAKKNDNGVMKKVQIVPDLVSKGNCILFICDGEGSVGYTNYEPEDFIGSTTCSVGYDDCLNQINAMFLVTILDKEKYKFSYGRKYRANLNEICIRLPILKDLNNNPVFDKSLKYSSEGYIPDWQFMEDYIKSINHKPITTKNKGGQLSPILGQTNWKEYKLTDIFPIIEQGKAHDNLLDDGDEMVYIGAKKDDNGVMRHCANNTNLSHDGNCIVFICNGQGSVGYSLYLDRPFIATTDVKIGYGPNINKYTGLFLVTVLDRERGKYSFGRKWGPHIKNTILRLPTKNSQPDWEFMENYIKRLPYGDRI